VRVLAKFHAATPGVAAPRQQQHAAQHSTSVPAPSAHVWHKHGQQHPHVLLPSSPVEQRCLLTSGSWCFGFHQQQVRGDG
jgi:hypothetical protein